VAARVLAVALGAAVRPTRALPAAAAPALARNVHGTAVFVALGALGAEARDVVASVTEAGVKIARPDEFAVRIRFGATPSVTALPPERWPAER
jgi:hypothetical protein